jgi:hypothetical protein
LSPDRIQQFGHGPEKVQQTRSAAGKGHWGRWAFTAGVLGFAFGLPIGAILLSKKSDNDKSVDSTSLVAQAGKESPSSSALAPDGAMPQAVPEAKSSVEEKKPATGAVEAPTVNTDAPVMSVSAMQLQKEYKANSLACRNRYSGKILRVSGIVHDVRFNDSQEPYLRFRDEKYEVIDAALLNVIVYFKDRAQATTLQPGQSVVLKGLFGNRGTFVGLTKSVID